MIKYLLLVTFIICCLHPSIPILDVGGDEISKINHDIDGFHDNIDEILYTHRIPPCSSLTTNTSRVLETLGDPWKPSRTAPRPSENWLYLFFWYSYTLWSLWNSSYWVYLDSYALWSLWNSNYWLGARGLPLPLFLHVF